MNLSLEKMPGFGVDTLTQINLHENVFLTREGISKHFDPEQWPIMIFMKGLGFEKIIFKTTDTTVLENWAQRITTYQQEYLFDPENFRSEECQWNESDETSGLANIECHWESKHPSKDHLKTTMLVPPLEAPLGVDTETSRKFIDEVSGQSPQEILLRVHSLLKEYEKDSKNKDPQLWGSLVADVVSVALESRFLEKAIEIAETHSSTMENLWDSSYERVARLFSAYDPKGAELFSWSRIFSTFPSAELIKSYESYLASPAGPQMIKLLNYRIQNQSDEMIDICFEEGESIQKHLLQWLTPHWREKHYSRILLQIENRTHPSLTRLWVTALLRSSTSRALLDLEKFFPKKSFWERRRSDAHFQSLILDILAEHPSTETALFIRKIKSRLTGKLAGQAETILQRPIK